MIEVNESAKTADGPARSLREIFDRLSVLVGRVIRVELRPIPGDDNRWSRPVALSSTVGTLRWLSYKEGTSSQVTAFIDKPSAEQSKPPNPFESLDLRSEISVLTDGQWRMIHDPVALVESIPGTGTLRGHEPTIQYSTRPQS